MTDGWTKTDVIYVWDDSSALQLVPNMSLPGGFKLKMFGSDYCDVTTNTGQYSCLQVTMAEPSLVNEHSVMSDSSGGPGVCQGALLLHGDHVCPLHHDSGRLLVCILD